MIPLHLDPLPPSPSQRAELTQNQKTENVAQDLESFSRHAGRTTVTTDDVLLVTRRNEALQGIMVDFVERGKAGKERERVEKAKGKGKERAK